MVKTQKSTHSTNRTHKSNHYFDLCTQLLYKDREDQLLNQLCGGIESFSQHVLQKELTFFLKYSEDRTHAASLEDKEELCHYLRTTTKHSGLFHRILHFFTETTQIVYHGILQSLNSNHYLITMMNDLRFDNTYPLFQYVFFQSPSKSSTKTHFTTFVKYMKALYGEEFFLVLCNTELQSLQKKYKMYLNQLLFMKRKKGFQFDDVFTERNPKYFFDTNIDSNIVNIFKDKLTQITENCKTLRKHIHNSQQFGLQTTRYRKFLDKKNLQENMQRAREKRIAQIDQRNFIEKEKLLNKKKLMKERNNIELQKLLLKFKMK